MMKSKVIKMADLEEIYRSNPTAQAIRTIHVGPEVILESCKDTLAIHGPIHKGDFVTLETWHSAEDRAAGKTENVYLCVGKNLVDADLEENLIGRPSRAAARATSTALPGSPRDSG